MLDPRRLVIMQLALFLVLSISLIPAPPSFSANAWIEPVVGAQLVNSFRQPETPYGAGHRGVDYGVKQGQPVFAVAEGVVHFVGKVVDRAVISIRHPGSYLSAYEPVCSELKVGATVLVGELIGEICESDPIYSPHCQKTCLHLSARLGQEYLSPQALMGQLRPSVVLPWIEPD